MRRQVPLSVTATPCQPLTAAVPFCRFATFPPHRGGIVPRRESHAPAALLFASGTTVRGIQRHICSLPTNSGKARREGDCGNTELSAAASSDLFRLAVLGTFPSIGEGDKTHSFHRIFEVSTVPRDYWASPTHQPRCCGGGSKGDRHLREVRCACPPLVPFLVTFCGTTKSNCPRGMSASCKKKKSPIPRTKPGHRRMDCGTTKRTVRNLRHERKL